MLGSADLEGMAHFVGWVWSEFYVGFGCNIIVLGPCRYVTCMYGYSALQRFSLAAVLIFVGCIGGEEWEAVQPVGM